MSTEQLARELGKRYRDVWFQPAEAPGTYDRWMVRVNDRNVEVSNDLAELCLSPLKFIDYEVRRALDDYDFPAFGTDSRSLPRAV